MKDDSPYTRYENLLIRLHKLIEETRGDSEEADQVRDDLDDLRMVLKPEEVVRLDKLSGDLYSFAGREIFPNREPILVAPSWDGILEILRVLGGSLPPEQLAFIRGSCWAQLGRDELALRFFNLSVELVKRKVKP